MIVCNFIIWEQFYVSGSHKTPIPGVKKLRFLLTGCPLLFTHWLSHCTIALLQKNQQISPVNASKNSIEVSFVTPGMEKFEEKKVEDFLFLPYGGSVLMGHFTVKSEKL